MFISISLGGITTTSALGARSDGTVVPSSQFVYAAMQTTAAGKLVARRSYRGDATEVLQATEHALDGVTALIEDGRETILPASAPG
jgi:hypothetical protein